MENDICVRFPSTERAYIDIVRNDVTREWAVYISEEQLTTPWKASLPFPSRKDAARWAIKQLSAVQFELINKALE